MTTGDPEFNFVERRGSASSVKTFTRGVNCGIISYEKDVDFIRNKLQVLGYGSGANQVKSGILEDVTSQSSYGIREKTEVDRSITTTDTAYDYCNQLLDFYKDPLERFVVQTTFTEGRSIVTGDEITVVDSKLSINGDYRIVNIERSFGTGGNFMNLFVANKQQSLVRDLENTDSSVSDEQEMTSGDTIRQGEDFIVQASATGGYPDEENAYVRFTAPSGGTKLINEVSLNLNVTKFRVPVSSGGVGSGGAGNYTMTDVDYSQADTSGSGGGGDITGITNSIVAAAVSCTSGSWVRLGYFTNPGGARTSTSIVNGNFTVTSGTIAGGSPFLQFVLSTNSTASGSTLSGIESGSAFCEMVQQTHTHAGSAGSPWGSHNHGGTVADGNIGGLSVTGSHSDKIQQSYTLLSGFDWNGDIAYVWVKNNSTNAVTIDHFAYMQSMVSHTHVTYTQSMDNETGSTNISHDDHAWTYVAGISAETLPGINYDVYVGVSSAAPEDDETEAWQNSATQVGTSISDKIKEITLSDSLTFNPDTRYTIKIKPTADIEFQANVQTTHFHDETEL